MEDWAEIRRLHRREGLPLKAIVRVPGISRNTVRAAIASDGTPTYERTPAGSIVDEFQPRIRELLRSYLRMPAKVIAERIGWERALFEEISPIGKSVSWFCATARRSLSNAGHAA